MNQSIISPVVLPFAMCFLFGMVLLGVPYKATSLGASYSQLGYFASLGAFCFTLFVVIAGRLIGRISPRQSITIGCLLFAACSLIIAFVENLNILYPLVAGYSIGLAFYWPALESKLGDVSHLKHVLRRTGTFNVSVSVGFMFGFLFSGIFFNLRHELPFITAAAFAIFLPIIFLFDKPAEYDEIDDSTPDEIIPPKAIRYLYLAWMSNAASHFAMINLSNIFPKLGRELAMTETEISVLLFSMRLMMSFFFIALMFSRRWHFSLRFLVSFQVIQILGLLIVASVESMALFIPAFIMVGAGGSVTYYSSLYYGLVLSRKEGAHDESKAGRHSGLHEFYIGLGILSGPVLGGLSADYISIRGPYLLAASVMALMIAAELIYYYASRPAKDQGLGSPSTS